MRTDANWSVRAVAIAMVLALVFMALSCGGGGSATTDLGSNTAGNQSIVSSGKSIMPVVSEDEIGTLPAWQQELLSDPGWNQPYIEPTAGTPIEAPSYEMLMEMTEREMAAGMEVRPRGYSAEGKSVSWDDQGAFAGETVVKGEYYNVTPRGATPPFGCNNDGSDESAQGNAIEDLIDSKPMPLQRISYVLEGLSSPNYFNTSGGSGGDMQSAVYQLFSDNRDADPKDPASAVFAELGYNSGLLGGGVGPGGDCSGAEAFQTEGKIWARFNSDFNVMPGLASTELYNILIAPAADASNEETSMFDTTARWQPFYFGTVSGCYGGAIMFSLVAADGACNTFNKYVTDDAEGFFTRPLYGALLKRWQEMNPSAPWEGPLGWPVFGPVAYANGSPVLTAKGQYFAWGMWYEKGFAWWIDYDQVTYPNTPDEIQVYSFTGSNVYCRSTGDEYIPSPPVYYGGSGDLSGTVLVEGSRNDPGDPWEAVPFNGSYYELALPSGDGLATVNVKLFATGNGGVTRSGADEGHAEWGDCLYKYYVWAFRNGTIQAAGTAYDPDQRFANTSYGSLLDNRESIYVVRVQITDASMDEGASGSEVFTYADSYPILLGHGGGGGGGGETALTATGRRTMTPWRPTWTPWV